ncbi:YbaB/EbfC family nucleoid-associated protein [Actinoplanes solisilvae]|uniref:YbaB/EbfC family nucleoid-associated protein n=1 Tax=Actinoplanes solisilvae TaxID=2486853 RepID=UPI0013E324FD|nr:YbaB/EbfC family nucleoid-associated protein [Actinoplanes solisilvae]
MNSQDYRQLAERMQQLTAETQRIREDYDKAEVTGVSGDGSVRATVRAGKLISLSIAPSALEHDNFYMAAQVLTAVREAEEQAAQFLSAQTSPVADAVQEFGHLFQ